MKLFIDYGGTYLRYELNQTTGQISSKDIDLVEFIENIIAKNNIEKIGISFAGQVKNGKIISSPNTNIPNNFDITQYFKDRCNIELLIENDLKCACIAQRNHLKENYIATIYIGTGLGCAYIEDTLIRGYDNLACELGHIPYKKTDFICGCGKDNCLELTCSGKALKLRNLKTIEENKIFEIEFNNAINYAIEIVSILFNPKIIVLGGGVVEHNRLRIEPYLPNFTNVKTVFNTIDNAPIEGIKYLLNNGGSYYG